MSLLALALVVLQKPEIEPNMDLIPIALRDFVDWDADGDGNLTRKELGVALLDPRWKDRDGAAISSLVIWKDMHPALPPYTKRWLADFDAMRFPPMPKGLTAEESTKETRRRELLGWGIRVKFRECLGQIRRGPFALYDPEGPKQSDIQQFRGGDCLMLSVLGAVVDRNPEDVRRMIQVRSDGYTVVFPDGVIVRRGFLTDAEIGLDYARLDHGLWVRLLEETFYRRPLVEVRPGKRIPIFPFHALTNHGLQNVNLIGDYKRPATDAQLEALAAPLRSLIPATLGRKRIVACGTHGGVPMPPRIPGSHGWAVMGYEPVTDVITVWNPWGDSWRQGPGMDGITLDGSVHGIIHLKLKTFVRVFDSIGFELDKPYPRVS